MCEVSCSDVRERFHLFALLFVVVVQTMKEYGWREEDSTKRIPLRVTSQEDTPHYRAVHLHT